MYKLDKSKGVLVALFAMAICASIFFIHAQWPGLYMDSINPEYLAVRITNPDVIPGLHAWIVPGNLIAGKYPVLAGSYYHGPLQLYTSLPVYLAFGTDIGSARGAQFMYAAFVLLALWALLRTAGVANAVVLAGLCLLAIDPAFVQAFKTQALSILWPLSLLLLSIVLIERRLGRGWAPRWWELAISGFLAGLSFFSYFVYLFFAPVLYLHVVWGMRRQARLPLRNSLLRSSSYLGGYLLGTVPYFLGFGLMYAKLGGMENFLAAMTSGAQELQVIRPTGGVGSSLAVVLDNVTSAMTDTWVNLMVLGQTGWSENATAAGLTFMSIPLLLGIAAWRLGIPARLLHLANALVVTYLLFSLPFANRLSGHHYTLLPPLVYLAWMFAYHYLARPGLKDGVRKGVLILGGMAAVLVLAGSVRGQWRFLDALQRTGGVAGYSDAINRMSADALVSGKGEYFYFPDWGFAMPFQFLTHGSISARNGVPASEQLRQLACRGRSVNVVYDLQGPESEQAKAAHTARLSAADGVIQGYKPKRTEYRGRDGRLEFTVVRYLGEEARTAACAGLSSPTLRCAVSTAAPDIKLAADPCDIQSCPADQSLPVVRVRWDSGTHAKRVEVWVRKGSDRKLWINTGAKGEASTGPWSNPGVEFEFVDADSKAKLGSVKLGGLSCPL